MQGLGSEMGTHRIGVGPEGRGGLWEVMCESGGTGLPVCAE